MEQRTKIILILLSSLLVVSLFVSLQLHNAKVIVERDIAQLRTENNALNMQAMELKKDNKSIREQAEGLKSEMQNVISEKESIQKQIEEIKAKYDTLEEEKEELAEKLSTGAGSPAINNIGKGRETAGNDSYWAGVLKNEGDLSLRLERASLELKNISATNEELKRKNTGLELEIKDLMRERQDLEQQLGYKETIFDNMTSELVLERNTKRDIQDKLREIKNENSMLKRQLDGLVSRKISLEKKLVSVQDEKADIERKFNEMAILLENRLGNISDIKERLGGIKRGEEQEKEPQLYSREQVELPPIIVNSNAQEQAGSREKKYDSFSIWGGVLQVDDKNNFIVIDIGSDSGVREGDRLQIMRSGKDIATVEAIQVRNKISACDIIEKNMAPEEGDIVKPGK